MSTRLKLPLAASVAAHAGLLWVVSAICVPTQPERGLALVAVRILEEDAGRQPARPPAPEPRPVWTPRAASTPPSRAAAPPRETSRPMPDAPLPALFPRSETGTLEAAPVRLVPTLPVTPANRQDMAHVSVAQPVPEEPVALAPPPPAPEGRQEASPVKAPAAQEGEDGMLVPATFLAECRPKYPLQSRLLGEQGMATLSVEIGADGTVGVVTLVKSSGHERLDRAAIEALRAARLAPARRGGKPVASVKRIAIAFRLTDAEEE